MSYCRNFAKTISLLCLVFLFGAHGSFAISEPLRSDIGGPSGAGVPDGKVNFFDFAILANEWLESSSDPHLLKADLNRDSNVNLADLASMSIEWLNFNESPVNLLEDANFCRNSVAFLDGKEYAPDVQRFTTIAECNVSDCVIHGAENILGVGPVILAPKCSAGGYIYATQIDHRNIYRSSDGITWERTADFLGCAWLMFGTKTGAILVAKPSGEVMRFYRSTDGGSDLSDYHLPDPVLTFGHTDSVSASVQFYNYHQARNGTICISEYGPQYGFKESRIYRSVDDGVSFTEVYNESDDVFHSHRIMKHEATGRWVNVYGDGSRNKVVMSDDDGLTWSTLDPQPDNYFQPVEFYDYGHPTDLLYGSDESAFIGAFNVLTRKITPFYKDGNRLTPFVFSIYYHDGVFYAGTFGTKWPDTGYRGTAILASSDLVHWAVYHEFRNGERDVEKFLGVFGGKMHGVLLDGSGRWRHFSFTPVKVTLVEGLCMDPATENMLNNSQDSSVENNTSHWSASGTVTRITTDALHGTGCLRVVGNSGIETVYPLSKPVKVGNTYSCRVYLKAKGMNLIGRAHWYVYGTSREGLNSYFCLSQDDWTEIVLPPVTIGAGESYITIHICPRGSDWPGPYDFLVDAAQYEAGPPSRWQVGGVPRANETLSKSVSAGESWTDLLKWAPECRSEWYNGFGNQYIKTWYKDPNNYLEFYFDPSDSTFALQTTVSGIHQTPIKTSPYTFYRNGVIRSAIRCDANSLILSVAAAAAYEHVSSPPIDFLRSGTLISKTGDHSGTSMISCTLLSDVLYHSILPDEKLQ